jgi:ArsR family transcriptional regulator, repressor of sdpIR and other operons
MQEAYKAIADPTRRHILKYLRSGERTAGELAEYAHIGRTALSHHLTVLKLADLVRVERRGQFQVYTLNTTVLQDLMTELFDWFGDIETPTTDGQLSFVASSENEEEMDVSREDTDEHFSRHRG